MLDRSAQRITHVYQHTNRREHFTPPPALAIEEGLRQRAKEFAGAEVELYARFCEQSDY
jgi:hypothetical protein